MEESKTIEIDSLNYYESKFPNRKLVNIEKLKLIKTLREAGFNVTVLPDDGKPFQYVFTKGFKEVLTDPVLGYYINTATGFLSGALSGVLASFAMKLFDKKPVPNVTYNVQNIIFNNTGSNQNYSLIGDEISAGAVADIKEGVKEKKKLFERCFNEVPPFPETPTPIFLNHEPEIIGWGRIEYNPQIGLRVSNGIITHGEVKSQIDAGVYKGLSITGIAEKTLCSLCAADYLECNHISGEYYNGIKCSNTILKNTVIEISLVKEPINSECLLYIN